MLPVLVRLLAPSDPTRIMEAACGLVLVPKAESLAVGDPGAERELGISDLWTGWGFELQPNTGDIWALDDRRRRLSTSSNTTPDSKSAGSSILALLRVKVRSCSESRSQPKNERKSISMISNALKFLKA